MTKEDILTPGDHCFLVTLAQLQSSDPYMSAASSQSSPTFTRSDLTGSLFLTNEIVLTGGDRERNIPGIRTDGESKLLNEIGGNRNTDNRTPPWQLKSFHTEFHFVRANFSNTDCFIHFYAQ